MCLPRPPCKMQGATTELQLLGGGQEQGKACPACWPSGGIWAATDLNWTRQSFVLIQQGLSQVIIPGKGIPGVRLLWNTEETQSIEH